MKQINEKEFKQTLADNKLVLVDFYATWCPPCKTLEPHVAAVAEKLAGSLLVVKVDSDEASATCQELNVRSLPTLILFLNGKEVQRSVGAIPRVKIFDMVLPHIEEKSND